MKDYTIKILFPDGDSVFVLVGNRFKPYVGKKVENCIVEILERKTVNDQIIDKSNEPIEPEKPKYPTNPSKKFVIKDSVKKRIDDRKNNEL